MKKKNPGPWKSSEVKRTCYTKDLCSSSLESKLWKERGDFCKLSVPWPPYQRHVTHLSLTHNQSMLIKGQTSLSCLLACLFKIGGRRPTIQSRLAWNLETSCFSSPSAGIQGVCHCAQAKHVSMGEKKKLKIFFFPFNNSSRCCLQF